MDLELFTVPYDSGLHDVRMGRGPDHLVRSGLVAGLEADGHRVQVTRLATRVDPPTEIAVAFDLARSLAAAVRDARDHGRFPLVLAGNCFSAVGTVAGLGAAETGVLWLDAHGDLNTPDTSDSGFLDGMAAATLTGRCWRRVVHRVPGFAPLRDHRFALVGARDLDPPEAALIASVGLQHVSVDAFRRYGAGPALAPVLAATGAGISGYYLHIDLDVLDPAVARANGFAAPDGLILDDVLATIAAAVDRAGIAGAALTSYDPAFDADGRAAAAAITLARALAPSPAPAA